ALAIHLPEHNINAAQDNDDIRNGMAEAHVFEDRQVDKTGRADAITPGRRPAVADEVKAQFTFGRFNAAVGFAGFGPEIAKFDFGIQDRSGGNVMQGLAENAEGFAHFENPHHVTIKNVPPLSERHAEFEAIVNPVLVHFADVVIDSAGAQPRAGHAGIDRQVAREHAHALAAGAQDFVFTQERLKVVEEGIETGGDIDSLFAPAGREV